MAYAASALKKPKTIDKSDRLLWIQVIFIILGALVIARLFYLQIWNGATYKLLASDQHELQKMLVPERGKILVRDRADGTLHPFATNRDSWLLYSEPKNLGDPGETAREIEGYVPDITEAELVDLWISNPDDPYEPIAKGLQTREAEEILEKNLSGIGLIKGWSRFYPETDIGGHIIGFVRTDDLGIGEGAYGIEGAYDELLAGESGFVSAQKDAGGRRLMLQGGQVRHAVDGSDIILTIDRTIQFETCKRLKQAVERFDADGGSVIIMDPNSGAIIALCSMPDFDPAHFGDVDDIGVFNNPVTFSQYEPGSVFKPFTMAIGIERGRVGPETTYEDKGVETIDDYDIKNSDEKAHGIQTMRQVLEKSLNTGTIFVQRQIGRDAFQKGVEAFGFGKKTGIELTPEVSGNISSLSKKADVYGATGSFGQGISVTPIQLVTAFAALANGGRLLKPFIIEEIIHPDGRHEKTKAEFVGQPISMRTSQIMRGMLVSVVERGHGNLAAVPGYYVAGKTGTAQVANSRGLGYLEGVSITSFAGFAPADDPVFVMLVKLDRPRAGKWSSVNTAPLFSDIASFLLAYLEVPTERDRYAPKETDSVPDLPSDLSTAPDIVSIDTEAGEQLDEDVEEQEVPLEAENDRGSE
jgi:cell division protein FtsI/penicillin-binding protein 2